MGKKEQVNRNQNHYYRSTILKKNIRNFIWDNILSRRYYHNLFFEGLYEIIGKLNCRNEHFVETGMKKFLHTCFHYYFKNFNEKFVVEISCMEVWCEP